jgi:hypothetical protein
MITLMMVAVRTHETTVYSETTRRYITEDSYLHTRLPDNLKSNFTEVTQLGSHSIQNAAPALILNNNK